PYSDYGAWEILRQFASSDMTLPEAEARLSSHLGDCFKDDDWQPALKAVMDSEGDRAIQELSAACEQPRLTIRIPTLHPPQLVATENELLASVEKLKSKNQVFGELPTAEELTNSAHEHKVTEESPYAFPGGDLEIVEKVRYKEQVKCGEIIEIDEEEEEGEPDSDADSSDVTRQETILLISQLERLSIRFGGGEMNTTDLTRELHQFCGHLFREDLQNARQTSLDSYFLPVMP
ncbi:hypothetical protein V8E53_009898, partial [Lactarius tabidus]